MTVYQCLTALLDKAQTLAESAPTTEARRKHARLARYLIQRIARRVLREHGIAPANLPGKPRKGGK